LDTTRSPRVVQPWRNRSISRRPVHQDRCIPWW